MKRLNYICLLLWMGILCGPFAWGQTPAEPTGDDTSDIDSAVQESLSKPSDVKEEEVEIKNLPDVKDISGLANLAPFSDIAVIEKRFLPKTNRLEIFPNVGAILNDAFFTNTELGLKAAFYFTESWGVEAGGHILGTMEKKVTSDMRTSRGISTRSLITPQYFYGADIKWSPVYGKMALSGESIIPFDMYFNLGLGMTRTNQDSTELTYHFGVGNLFALSKWAAFRWDLSWYVYSPRASSTSSASSSGSFTNIYASLGLSFFWPKAGYR